MIVCDKCKTSLKERNPITLKVLKGTENSYDLYPQVELCKNCEDMMVATARHGLNNWYKPLQGGY